MPKSTGSSVISKFQSISTDFCKNCQLSSRQRVQQKLLSCWRVQAWNWILMKSYWNDNSSVIASKSQRGIMSFFQDPKRTTRLRAKNLWICNKKCILPGWRVGRGGKKWREKKSDEVREGCKKMGKVWSFTIPPRYGLFFRKKLTPIFVVENCIFNGRKEFYAWSHFKNK